MAAQYTDSSDGEYEDPHKLPVGFDPKKECHEVDFSDPLALCGTERVPYRYVPTKWVGAVFTGAFLLLTIGHFLQASLRWKRGGFMILAGICALGEFAGWTARLRSSIKPFDRNAYITQMVCLILSPVFISAANYVTFEKLQGVVGHELSRLTPKVYFGIFLTGDIVSLVVQAVGGGMSAKAKDDKTLDRGTNIMIGGVIIQILVTLPFTLLFLDYHIRHYLKSKREGTQVIVNSYGEKVGGSRWTNDLITISAASFFSTMMILTRCIYRAIEMIEGWHGKLAVTEVYFCVLDGLLIFMSVLIFNFFHPGFRFGAPESATASSASSHLEKGNSHSYATPVHTLQQQPASQNSAYPTYNSNVESK